MEVLSFFSNNKNLINYFDNFLNNHSKLFLYAADKDTKFFRKMNSDKNDIYFHFHLLDIKNELSFNYRKEDVKKIYKYFKGCSIYLFDIQYRDENLIRELILNFNEFLKEIISSDNNLKILISHPFDGLESMNEIILIS